MAADAVGVQGAAHSGAVSGVATTTEPSATMPLPPTPGLVPGSGAPVACQDPDEMAVEIGLLRAFMKDFQDKVDKAHASLTKLAIKRYETSQAIDRSWVLLVKFDTEMALYQAGKISTNPEDTYGPRNVLQANWVNANRTLREIQETIDVLLNAISIANARIVQLQEAIDALEAQLQASCDGPPAPPSLTS